MLPLALGVAISVTFMLTALVGCGSGDQKLQARRLQEASILSTTAPLSERLIKQSEIRSASDAEAAQTFLQLWSLLQFQAWDQAEQLFEPGLRSIIGPSLLAQALESDVLVWQATKPKIVTTRVVRALATISFLARNEQGHVLPTSVSFGRSEGKWRVAYLPLLNPALARTAELRAQAQLEPLGTKPNAEAVRQGSYGGQLQQIYLERKLRGRGVP